MKPETLGEVHIMFQNLLGEVRELADHVKENTKLTEQVLVQATKTNGRVNVIEPLAFDFQETRARVKGGVFIVALVGASALTIGGFAMNSYINYKTTEIAKSVTDNLENKHNIQINK